MPAFVAMLAMLFAAQVMMVHHLQTQAIDSDLVHGDRLLEDFLGGSIAHEERSLSGTLVTLRGDPRLAEALQRGDRDALHALTRTRFQELRSETDITHLYFLDPERRCLLRAHHPDRHGDIIDRQTALHAESTGSIASGLELGELDTVTLRTIAPWLVDGERIGYVEVGVELEHVFDEMSGRPEHALYGLVRKDRLERESWEEGMRILGRPAQWDRLPDHVYVGRGVLPGWIGQLASAAEGEETTSVDLSEGGREHRILLAPIQDVSNQNLGLLVLDRDTTEIWIAAERTTMAIALLGVLLMLLAGFAFGLRMWQASKALERSRRELLDSERKLSAMTASVRDGIIMVDARGRVAFWNLAAQSILGHSAEEVMGEDLVGLTLPPAEQAEWRGRLTNASIRSLEGPSGARRESRWIGRDGNAIPVEISIASLDIYGQTHAVCVVRDITLRKEIERRREASLREAQEATRELGEFTSAIAHDLRTPLVGIDHLTSWLTEDFGADLSKEAHAHLQMIRERNRGAQALVEGMLQYAIARRSSNPLESVDTRTMCEDIAETLAHGSEPRILISPDLPRVRMPRAALQQVFESLLHNAVRYVGGPGGEVRIECRELPDHWEFAIIDTGPGIPSGDLLRIFRRFERGSSGGGTGLGLALAKQIIDRYGGRIWAESAIGEGATFCFTIPKQPRLSSEQSTLVAE
ncbi:MAG: ATP-binding protein [Myxococcales bacterium]|nr:ATP-binding protein [Myxococcales bacterium]